MHPIIFQTKLFTLHTLWIFLALGIITGTYTLIKLGEKNSLKLQFLSENSWRLILLGFIGARIATLFINYNTYFYEFSTKTVLRIFYIWDKGLSIWGGIIVFIITLFFLCKKTEQDFWKWIDVIVPSTIIALTIIHIGAFFDGINYGKETSLPWGVNFESPSIKYAVPIHPTQIYAFLYSLVIAISLIMLSQTKKIKNIKKAGFIGIIGTAFYALFHFLEGFLRGDDTLMIYNIRAPQILALIIFISTGTFLYFRYNKPRKKTKH